MKNIIPFKKDVIFKTKISEITSISLENSLSINKDVVSGEFIIGGEYKVSDKIAVSYEGEIITVNSFDKVFKIYPACVIIGDNKFSRTLSKDFYDASSTEITFSENSQLVVRRGTDG